MLIGIVVGIFIGAVIGVSFMALFNYNKED